MVTEIDDSTTALKADPKREGMPEAGIFVRAMKGERWVSVDISHLERDSLDTWLRSRGGANPWAESVVAILLGHEPDAGTGEEG